MTSKPTGFSPPQGSLDLSISPLEKSPVYKRSKSVPQTNGASSRHGANGPSASNESGSYQRPIAVTIVSRNAPANLSDERNIRGRSGHDHDEGHPASDGFDAADLMAQRLLMAHAKKGKVQQGTALKTKCGPETNRPSRSPSMTRSASPVTFPSSAASKIVGPTKAKGNNKKSSQKLPDKLGDRPPRQRDYNGGEHGPRVAPLSPQGPNGNWAESCEAEDDGQRNADSMHDASQTQEATVIKVEVVHSGFPAMFAPAPAAPIPTACAEGQTVAGTVRVGATVRANELGRNEVRVDKDIASATLHLVARCASEQARNECGTIHQGIVREIGRRPRSTVASLSAETR